MNNSVIEILKAVRIYSNLIDLWSRDENIDIYQLNGDDNKKVIPKTKQEAEYKLEGTIFKTSLIRMWEAFWALNKYINASSTLLGNDNYQCFLKQRDKKDKLFMGMGAVSDKDIDYIVIKRLTAEQAIQNIVAQGRYASFTVGQIQYIVDAHTTNAFIFNHIYGCSAYTSMASFLNDINGVINPKHMTIYVPGNNYFKNEIETINLFYKTIGDYFIALGQMEYSIIHLLSKIRT